jgi:hypothetical protein
MRTIFILTLLSFIFGCSSKPKNNSPVESKDTAVSHPDVTVKKPSIDSSLFVFDTATKLCWMKRDFSFLNKRFLKEWKEIFEWQDKMNLSNYGGLKDWIVPSISQYRTINNTRQDRLIYKKRFLELDTVCVWGRGPYSYWSSTTPNKHTASYISFIDGFATSGSRTKQFSSIYSSWKGVELGMSVRLVRLAK